MTLEVIDLAGSGNSKPIKVAGNPLTNAIKIESIDSTGVTIVPASSAQIGEVQASPTQYTLLDRLKTLSLSQGAIGDTQATNATGSWSIIALLKGLYTATIAPLVAGENHIGEVGGKATMVSAEFTRPADTTAYAVGDVVSDSTVTTSPLLIQNIFRVAGGSGYVTSIKIVTNLKSVTPRFRVHFFNVNTATLAADNTPYKELYADIGKRLKPVDMDAMATAVDTTNSDMSRTVMDNLNCLVVAANGSRDLYVVLEALDAFTPTSGEKFTVTVFMDNN